MAAPANKTIKDLNGKWIIVRSADGLLFTRHHF
jgi:hypothetical protein